MNRPRAWLRNHLTAGASLAVVLAACSSTAPPLIERDYPPPRLSARGTELGKCSWYGPGFHGKPTASGEIYDQNAMTAAHRTLPLGTTVEVTDLSSGRRVRVRVNDRGPYHRDRVLDLSHAAAAALGTIHKGVADVEIRVLDTDYTGYPVVRYDLQLGAYRSRAEAERLARRATARGAPARVERSSASLYHVRVGPFAERSQAADAARTLRDLGFAPVIVEVAPRAGRSAHGAPRYALRTAPRAQARYAAATSAGSSTTNSGTS